MAWHKEYLDSILVPSGLFIMILYHLFLVRRCIKCPERTSIGFENHSKSSWVRKMMQLDVTSRNPAHSVLTSNIKASTSMASTSLTVSSLIATLAGNSPNSDNYFTSGFIYGDTRPFVITLKYISILAFFIAAFAFFVQTTRLFVHANFLISMAEAAVPTEFVEIAVVRGTYFWHAGLRAVYFATTLLMWVFGPIPMFASSVATVLILFILDSNKSPFPDFLQPPILLGQQTAEKQKAVVSESSMKRMLLDHN